MVDKNVILQEIQNQKELAIFFDTLNSLPTPQKRSAQLEGTEKYLLFYHQRMFVIL